MPMKGKPARRFGSRIIGQVAADEEKKYVDEKRVKFGPKVLGTQSAGGTTPLPGSEPVARTGRERVAKGGEAALKTAMNISISTMKGILKQNPAMAKELLDAELKRPEGPRKGALLALADVYESEEGQAIIEDALAALESGVDLKGEEEKDEESEA